jgi:hypothetical protein
VEFINRTRIARLTSFKKHDNGHKQGQRKRTVGEKVKEEVKEEEIREEMSKNDIIESLGSKFFGIK